MSSSSFATAARLADQAPRRLRLLMVVGVSLGTAPVLETESSRASERLLAATGDLERDGRLGVEFLIAPSLSVLRMAAMDATVDFLHVQGVFDHDPVTGLAGMLPMDADAVGRAQAVALAPILAPQGWTSMEASQGLPASIGTRSSAASGPSLVILDASAGGAASQAACDAVAEGLVAAGVPAVVCLANHLAGAAAQAAVRALLHALCAGADIRAAVGQTREHLVRAGLVEQPAQAIRDLYAPIAGSSWLGNEIMAMAQNRLDARPTSDRPIDGGTPPLGRAPLVRHLVRELSQGTRRSVVLSGPPGVGKTAVADAVAHRMQTSGQVEAVLTIRANPLVTVDEVLGELAACLGALGTPRLAEVMRRPVAFHHKVTALIEALAARRVLVVVDGADHWFAGAAAWSESPAADEPAAARQPAADAPVDPALLAQDGAESELDDPDLGRLVVALLTAPVHAPRWLFTSRVDFEPYAAVDRARFGEAAMAAVDALGEDVDAHATASLHVPLTGLGFEAAAQLMRGQPGLADLPVRAVGGAPSLRRLYEIAGDHPWALAHVAAWAARSSAAEVLKTLASSPPPRTVDALIERSAARLSTVALQLVSTAAILDEPIPPGALVSMATGALDTRSPAVSGGSDEEIDRLIAEGWLVAAPGGHSIEVAGAVRDWARRRIARSQRVVLWQAAARYWLAADPAGTGQRSELRAWRYLDLAGDTAAADAIVQRTWGPLVAGGQLSLAIRLLKRSVATLGGMARATALDHLARVLLTAGDAAYAADIQTEALHEYEASGDWRLVAAALQQLGRLQQARGEHDAARACYQRAMQVAEGMGDRRAAARGYCQLAVLAQVERQLDRALDHLARALDLAGSAGDHAAAMAIHNQLGMLHELRGDAAGAIDHFEQALAKAASFGDGAAMASTLHQLGLLHERAGAFDRARRCYARCLALAEKRADPVGAALSLHQLGLVHAAESHFERARTCFQRSLAIGRRLGAHGGVAGNLYQLGLLDELQGHAAGAREHYREALAAAESAGDRVAMVRALGRLGQICEDEGALDRAIACAVRSMVVLNQMGSPERDTAAGVLVRLRRSMPTDRFDEAFKAALQAERAVPPSRWPAG